jgi:hypothetical protein
MAINHVLQTAGDIYFTVNVTSVTISAPTSTDNETGLGVSHNRYGRLKAHDTVSGLESDWSNTVLVNTGIAPYSNFFADYDFNKPIYRTYTGHSVTVKDASNVSHDIGFTSGGLIDKAACDALTGPLKVQTLYDKSGNSRDVSLVGGGGDWYLLFDGRDIPYMEAQTDNARLQTAANVTVTLPKIFSVAWTKEDQAHAYLVDFGGNKFALDSGSPSYYDPSSTYTPSVGQYGYNGGNAYFPTYDVNSFLLYTNETAMGLHQRAMLFRNGSSDKLLIDDVYYATGNAGGTAATGKLTVGNYDAGSYSGRQRFYDLKVVDGTISDADATRVAELQIAACQVNEEDVFVVFGDSMAFSYDAGSIYANPVVGNISCQLMNTLGREGWYIRNEGWTGLTTGTLIANKLAHALTFYRAGKTNNFYLSAYYNDFNNGVSMATTTSNIQAIVTAAKNAGFRVFIDVPPRSAFNGENYNGYDAWYAAMLAWVQGGGSGADEVVDTSGDSHIGTGSDTTNTTYFFSDHIHLKAGGCAIKAAAIVAAM